MSISPYKSNKQDEAELERWLDIFRDKFNTAEDNITSIQNDLATLQTNAILRGCVPSSGSDSDHDITFTSGQLGTKSLPAYTKQFDASFAEGDNAGGLGGSVTLPASGTFYIFAISKDSSPSTIDYFGDTSSSGANIPSGWTLLKEVHRLVTDGSNNFYSHLGREEAGGSVYIEMNNGFEVFSDNNPGTTAQTKTITGCPPDVMAETYWVVWNSNAANRVHFLVTSLDQTDIAVTNTNRMVDVWRNDGTRTFSNNVVLINKLLNASSQLRYRVDFSDGGTFIECFFSGYRIYR